MPLINVTCPACSSQLELEAQFAHQDVQCGSCGKVFQANPNSGAPADRPSRRRSESDEDEHPRRRTRRRDRDDDDYDDAGYERPRRHPRDAYGGAATASMILGICSIPAFCCWPLGVMCAVAGIICGVIGLKSRERHGQALAGLILSVLFILTLAGLLIFAGFAPLAMPGNGGGGRWNNPPPARNNGNW